MSGTKVLVVGSYPPIPLPAAAASVAAVQGAWAAGDEVTVVSPRLSAAHLAVPVAGIFAGRRLANLRRHTSATRAVLVLEPDMPVPGTSGGQGSRRGLETRLIQWLTVRGMVWAFRGFDHVTLVRVGDLGIPARVEADLLRAASEVLDHVGDESAAAPVLPRPDGVTPLGPPEVLARERPRQLAGLAARQLLGRRAAPVRARLAAAVHAAQGWLEGKK